MFPMGRSQARSGIIAPPAVSADQHRIGPAEVGTGRPARPQAVRPDSGRAHPIPFGHTADDVGNPLIGKASKDAAGQVDPAEQRARSDLVLGEQAGPGPPQPYRAGQWINVVRDRDELAIGGLVGLAPADHDL